MPQRIIFIFKTHPYKAVQKNMLKAKSLTKTKLGHRYFEMANTCKWHIFTVHTVNLLYKPAESHIIPEKNIRLCRL